jgi:ribosomal-protein-alanine N-acetyltransferase
MIQAHIREMIKRDLFPVLAIEQRSSRTPWGERDFVKFMREASNSGYVAEYREQILGYVLFQSLRSDTRLIELAVHPEYRMQGIGTLLMEQVVEIASLNNSPKIVHNVLERNVPSQLFLREFGFVWKETLHDFYDDIDEDVYRMELNLSLSLGDRFGSNNLVQDRS